MRVIFFSLFIMLFVACQSESKRKRDIALGQIKGIDVSSHSDEKDWPDNFGFGQKADELLIKKMNTSIPANGIGLPTGRGFAYQGEVVYQAKCASCHGSEGWEGPFDQLVARDSSTAKTIGNYWPYATTIFDYIRRAMPYNAPGSLRDEEVYQLTAFLLYANGVVEKKEEINAQTLPKIEMPARKLFVSDDRKGGHEIR